MNPLVHTWENVIGGLSPSDLLGKTKKLAKANLPAWMVYDIKLAYQNVGQFKRWERVFFYAQKKLENRWPTDDDSPSVGAVLALPRLKRGIAGYLTIRSPKEGEVGGEILGQRDCLIIKQNLHAAITAIESFLGSNLPKNWQQNWVIELQEPLSTFLTDSKTIEGQSWVWPLTSLLLGFLFHHSIPRGIVFTGEWEKGKARPVAHLDLKLEALHYENFSTKHFREIWVPEGCLADRNSMYSIKNDSKIKILPVKSIEDFCSKLIPDWRKHLYLLKPISLRQRLYKTSTKYAYILCLVILLSFYFFIPANNRAISKDKHSKSHPLSPPVSKYDQRQRLDKPKQSPSYPEQSNILKKIQKLRQQKITDNKLHSVLTYSLKQLKEINIENAKQPDSLSHLPSEIFVELLYLFKLRYKAIESGNPPDSINNAIHLKMQKISSSLEKDLIDLEYGFTSYSPSYTQWIALLLYAYKDDSVLWKEQGVAHSLLTSIVKISKEWKTKKYKSKRHRIDGSVVQLGMYTLITLYLDRNSTVGKAIGTPIDITPYKNSTPYQKRPLLIILENLCKFVESCYPSGNVPVSLGMKYSPNSSEGTNLAGGKILYFISKAILAYEQNNLPYMEIYIEKVWQVTFLLKEQKHTLQNTYALTYVIRAVALLMRIEFDRSGASEIFYTGTEIVLELLKFVKTGSTIKDHISKWYRPMCLLTYETEIRKICVKLAKTSTVETQKD